MSTFDDDTGAGLFEEPRRRPPRAQQRRPQRSGPRRSGPPASSSPVLRLAGLIALALVIVFGLVLACSGQSKGDYASYLTAMQPLAQKSAGVGAKFASEIGTPGLTMATFRSDLLSWSQQEQRYYVAAQRLQPPGLLQAAHAEALATFLLRAEAFVNLANTLTVAQSKHLSASAAAAALASDAQLLSASDTVWEQLFKQQATGVLKAQNVRGPIVPGSKIVTSPDIVSASSLGTIYRRVSTPTSGGKVTGLHGTTLISTSAVENGTPTALSATTKTTVSCCGNVVFDVVFQNSGKYPEVGVKVKLSVAVAGESVYTKSLTVPQIAEGQTATVHFTSVHLPTTAFAHNDAIYVKIVKVQGETNLADNAATYPVYFLLSH